MQDQPQHQVECAVDDVDSPPSLTPGNLVSTVDMVNVIEKFNKISSPNGEPVLMQWEGQQLAVALGVAGEGMDLVLQNEIVFMPGDVPGQVARWDVLLGKEVPPLRQVFWKDGPINVTVVMRVEDLLRNKDLFKKMCAELEIGCYNVLMLNDNDGPLYVDGTRWARIAGLQCDVIEKIHRPLASQGGTHLYGWHLKSTERSRNGAADPIFKIARLLSPGVEPKKLYVEIPPPPKDLMAICLSQDNVSAFQRLLDVPVDRLVVLPGPLQRETKWVLMRDVPQEVLDRIEEKFYGSKGYALCTYKAYHGELEECGGVVQAFWRKTERNLDNLLVFWCSVDWQIKQGLDLFGQRPMLQWAGANKLRLGFATLEDQQIFQQVMMPRLKIRGMVFKDERTGEFLDDDEVSSAVASSVGSGNSSGPPGALVQTVVVTDLPDYFLAVDVEDVIRKALVTRTVVGAKVLDIMVKRLEWSMGSPTLPTWQVSAKGISCLEGSMLALTGEGVLKMAMVHSWKEYSSARASWRARKPTTQRYQSQSQRQGMDTPKVVTKQKEVVKLDDGASSTGQMAMDVDWELVRGKRPRNECAN